MFGFGQREVVLEQRVYSCFRNCLLTYALAVQRQTKRRVPLSTWPPGLCEFSRFPHSTQQTASINSFPDPSRLRMTCGLKQGHNVSLCPVKQGHNVSLCLDILFLSPSDIYPKVGLLNQSYGGFIFDFLMNLRTIFHRVV